MKETITINGEEMTAKAFMKAENLSVGGNLYPHRTKDHSLARRTVRRRLATAQQHGLDGFTMILERKDIFGQEQWHSTFEKDYKKLESHRNAGEMQKTQSV